MFKGEVLPLVGDVPPFLSLTFAVHFSLPSSLMDISTGHVSLVTCPWVSDAFPLGYCSSHSFNEPRIQGQFWTQGISHMESIDSLGSPKLPVSTHYMSQYQTPKSFIALFFFIESWNSLVVGSVDHYGPSFLKLFFPSLRACVVSLATNAAGCSQMDKHILFVFQNSQVGLYCDQPTAQASALLHNHLML